MTSTPAETEPNRPAVDGTLATTAGRPFARASLTRTQKVLVGLVGTGTLFIAGLGFAGSYAAVTAKAEALGFGWFSNWITIGVDAGIGVFLALDLLLTWLRMPYPPLRPTAWVLTGATIAFNASASWPNPLGVAMHSVIPVLFVAAVEAARHAVGRMADITADKYMEGPPVSRWLLNPAGTFVLWRRQRLWLVREWDTVLGLERERRIYVARLRREHGRNWRRKATAEQLLVLSLAKDCTSIPDAIRLAAPEEEELGAGRVAIPVSATQQPAAGPVASSGGATAVPATARPAKPAITVKLTKSATRSATNGGAGSATPATAAPATATPATPAPATPVPATPTSGAEVRYEVGTPQRIVMDLWLAKGHRPKEGEIVDALGAARLANSRAQAGKIRRQVDAENPSLPGPRASVA